MLISRP
jgi:hypothetical protein